MTIKLLNKYLNLIFKKFINGIGLGLGSNPKCYFLIILFSLLLIKKFSYSFLQFSFIKFQNKFYL